MGLVCRDFAIVYVLAMIGMIVVALAIEALLQRDLGSAFNIVPQIVSAMIVGQRHGRRTGALPESGFSWKAAVWMTAIALALSLIAAGALVLYMGPDDAQPMIDFLASQAVVVTAIIGVVLLVYVLVSRYFFGLGAKQGVKTSPNADADVFR